MSALGGRLGPDGSPLICNAVTSSQPYRVPLVNRTFDELAIGDAASLVHLVSLDDIKLFAAVSGDVNPAHLDARYAAGDISAMSWSMACGREHCF